MATSDGFDITSALPIELAGKQTNVERLVQMSWTFINDSLRTNLCLKWEPEIVACAVLYLATKLNKQEIESWENQQTGQKWWESFVEGMTIEVMFFAGYAMVLRWTIKGFKIDEWFLRLAVFRG